MIFKLLDNVREKPESVRRHVAVFSTALIMGIIVLVWVSTLPDRLLRATEDGDENTSPFSVLAEQGKVFYDSATDGVSAARQILDGTDLPAAAILFQENLSPVTNNEDVIIPDLLGDSPFSDTYGGATSSVPTATTTTNTNAGR
ncbi:MAG: hypothetical protein AAB938_00185 [Patescibacteria group bacterium]